MRAQYVESLGDRYLGDEVETECVCG